MLATFGNVFVPGNQRRVEWIARTHFTDTNSAEEAYKVLHAIAYRMHYGPATLIPGTQYRKLTADEEVQFAKIRALAEKIERDAHLDKIWGFTFGETTEAPDRHPQSNPRHPVPLYRGITSTATPGPGRELLSKICVEFLWA